jgi:hypothetical protein
MLRRKSLEEEATIEHQGAATTGGRGWLPIHGASMMVCGSEERGQIMNGRMPIHGTAKVCYMDYKTSENCSVSWFTAKPVHLSFEN